MSQVNVESRPATAPAAVQTEPVLQVKNVSKIVPTGNIQLTILDNVSLEINQGQSVAIIGPSGAGKSTLLGLMAGLDTPSSGSISLGSHEITAMDEEGRARVRAELVGFVFQTFQLLSSLTAIENVALPLELSGHKGAAEKAKEYLVQVGLGARLSHYPKQLSGGEQQRVAIARAFACEPKILFADEPTGNLDQTTGGAVSDLLFDLNDKNGTTLILVTHEQRLAERCARIVTIDDGRIVD
ncbi:MAG: ABC transporter ATP-binding protein [Arenicella sp.]|jgi:putative ABC transport system ATP-binding protein|nr:ABC transporter ATP-binding protein [Arenicella sp.]